MAVGIALTASSITAAQADAPVFNGGAKIGISGWVVDDNDGSTRAKGSGSLLNLHLALHWDNAYAGAGLSGGKFDFGNHAPRQPTGTAAPSQSGSLQHGEFDAVFGYYFWERVSLFAALKSTSAKWDDGYTLSTGGLGAGVAAQHSIAPLWSLLWHFGVMSLDAKHDRDKIGTGSATTLEFSGVYHANASTGLNFGLKLQGQKLDFDTGVRQTHNLSTLGFGVNHAF
ncbi:MAG: hypothetical protein HY273_02735 [Gammaproteobacteria bacterium]|nr:hypothetical protein [Gammaproteobacteria bacterium]